MTARLDPRRRKNDHRRQVDTRGRPESSQSPTSSGDAGSPAANPSDRDESRLIITEFIDQDIDIR
jgi:hypothetical protein